MEYKTKQERVQERSKEGRYSWKFNLFNIRKSIKAFKKFKQNWTYLKGSVLNNVKCFMNISADFSLFKISTDVRFRLLNAMAGGLHVHLQYRNMHKRLSILPLLSSLLEKYFSFTVFYHIQSWFLDVGKQKSVKAFYTNI
jgi:hypothetical protein